MIMLKLSLIIPVYNEERHIKDCLDAVAAQTVKPDEVIVVDNNSTDKTIELAEKYPFVTVIRELKQGRGYARTTGFNAASGDIIGRIDADSRVHTNWVEIVKKTFSDDSTISGMTGLGYTMYVPFIRSVKSTIFSRAYYWFAHADFNTITMWGANMAISKKAWDAVSSSVCLDDKQVHEDQDVSLWIASGGGKLIQNNNLLITTNGQTYRYLPKTIKYLFLHARTKAFHKANGNLASEKLPKLGFFTTLPGRLAAIGPGLWLFLNAVILFPLDYVLLHIFHKYDIFD